MVNVTERHSYEITTEIIIRGGIHFGPQVRMHRSCVVHVSGKIPHVIDGLYQGCKQKTCARLCPRKKISFIVFLKLVFTTSTYSGYILNKISKSLTYAIIAGTVKAIKKQTINKYFVHCGNFHMTAMIIKATRNSCISAAKYQVCCKHWK